MTVDAAPVRRLRRSQATASRTEAGLSLIEVLVTLSILAFASALIVTTAPRTDPVKAEVQRLETLINQLHLRAMTSGRPMGLALERGGYQAAAWGATGWTTLPRSEHVLRKGIVLRSDDIVITNHVEAARPVQPELIFDPLGHSNLARISLSDGQRTVSIDLPAPEGSSET